MALEPQHAPTFSPLAEWVACYGPELRRHVARMLGGADEADDILQRVWLTAAQQPPLIAPDTTPRAWLYRVATNAALDRLARDRRRRAALDARGPQLLPDGDASPDEGVTKLDESARRRVREHVARLPRKQREAVWLRWVEGDDYSAIAAKLGCSEASARANVYQGMKRLRKELFDLWKKEYRE